MRLPANAGANVEVYVNGVPQRRGIDFRLEDGELVFERELAQEGRLGFWRWLSLFLGVAGTYRRNDTVDIAYELGGRRTVASGLAVIRREP